jgi:glyoxylase-like metal-dependent hydrolase (beta-lactamase superfamily II)/rhodanese-related sulfurtransferase
VEIVQFRTPGLGDQSYLLVHEGVGILVDPQRDIDRFLAAADERSVPLRFVLETHLHNDYVSGAEQAARRSGAELVMPAAAAAAYDHTPAFHQEEITADGLTIRPLHTPGHTPEHTSYLVLVDGGPVALFSGGSLLVGTVGRPDLLGMARARTLGRLQHGSIQRLARLPREVGLYPTHGQGSFCSASGADKYTSTIGEELDSNPLLAVPTGDELATRLVAEPMPIPRFYRYMGPANTLGVPEMPATTVSELVAGDLTALPEGTVVVDMRPRVAQAAGHLPGSLLVEIGDDFGSWTGWLAPYGAPIVLVAQPEQDVAAAVTQLAQIGIDSVLGVVRDLGSQASATFDLLTLPQMLAALAAAQAPQVLDVRMPSERADVRMSSALEVFVPELATSTRPVEEAFDVGRTVHVVCASGRRASIAAGFLVAAGCSVAVLTDAGVPDLVGANAALRHGANVPAQQSASAAARSARPARS